MQLMPAHLTDPGMLRLATRDRNTRDGCKEFALAVRSQQALMNSCKFFRRDRLGCYGIRR